MVVLQTTPLTTPPLATVAAPEAPPLATHSREESATEAMLADSPTVMRRVEEVEVDSLEDTTLPLVERPALAMHSREESAREVTDAVTTTERRVLVIPPLVTTVVGTGPVVCASPSRRVSSLQILHKCYECYISAFSLLQFASHAT